MSIYWQVIATIFTDDTSSVRIALVPDVAAGRLAADGSLVVAPAAPLVLVAPDALADAALPVTVMRWPTWAARSPPFSIQVADGAAPAPDGLGVEVAPDVPAGAEADALACWTFVNVKPPSAPFARHPVRLVSPAAAVVCDGVAD
jgi:hypothetical protein